MGSSDGTCSPSNLVDRWFNGGQVDFKVSRRAVDCKMCGGHVAQPWTPFDLRAPDARSQSGHAFSAEREACIFYL